MQQGTVPGCCCKLLALIISAAAQLTCLAVQKPTEEASWSNSHTEQDLRKADNNEPSYRCVPRLLCAGTSFNAVQDSSKEDCFKDMERLLGPCRDLAPFPVKGGRRFIAGKMHTRLS